MLVTQKAIIYESNPYETAEKIGKVLLADKKTKFFEKRHFREEAPIFWMACHRQILGVVSGGNVDDLWKGKLAGVDSKGRTMKGNIENVLDISYDDMLKLAKVYREEATGLGRTITDEEIAHLICGEIKRKQDWFPHEPKEYDALAKLGLD